MADLANGLAEYLADCLCLAQPFFKFTIFTKIDLIKIDVEGAEKEIWPILRNHWHQINYLLLEVHDGANPSLRQEMNKFIQDHKLESRWSVQWN